jgi:DNA-binding transcriptional LysR family regulator
MIDLRLIESFREAARLGGFSAAARSLRVSPAAVSQNIRALEDRLGVRLFERTTRTVRLTAEGARLFDHVTPALDALAEAPAVVGDSGGAVTGVLRITSTTDFGRAEILPLAASFQERHPALVVDITLTDGFSDLVGEGYDLAIRGGVLPDSAMIARLLIPVTPLCCAAPAYLARAGAPQTPADLDRHRVVGMRSNPTQRLFSWEFADADGAVVRHDIAPHLIVNDPAAAALAAAAGAGIAQVGSNVVLPFVRDGRLTIVLGDRAVRSRGIYAVWPSRRLTPRKVTAFVAHLVHGFEGRQDLVF